MKILITLGLLFSLNLIAREQVRLDNIFQKYDQLYQTLGVDNNYLEKIEFTTADMDLIGMNLKKRHAFISKVEQVDYSKLFKECLFIQQGAYGKHLSSQNQQSLADHLERDLVEEFILSPYVYRVDNLQLGFGENSCAVLFVGTLNNEAIVIQGVILD